MRKLFRVFQIAPLGLCLLPCSGLFGESLHLDIRQRGYVIPPRQYRKGFETFGSLITGIHRYLDFDSQNSAVVGFVVQNTRNQLSTPDDPALTWHVLGIDQEGRNISETNVPTRSWQDNGLFAGDKGTLLLRTMNDLTLISPDGRVVARRSLVKGFYWIDVMPSRHAFAVTRFGWIELLDMRTMTTISECGGDGSGPIGSVSDGSILTHAPSPSGNDYVRQVRVSKRCGLLEYAFDEARGTHGSSLLDDRTVVSTGAGTVAVYDQGVERWRDSFKRKNESADSSIRSDIRGNLFAVLVKSFTGGSRILDISSHISKARIVVYRTADGKRVTEVPIEPLPTSVFDFAISGDGKQLGVLSDGDLRIFPIPPLER